ncbi:MAG TPA: hypothetical protein VFU26_09135 [Gaiellaceae bacterium]|nr:hypothetical protein [Gaiellaceae bacterium]
MLSVAIAVLVVVAVVLIGRRVGALGRITLASLALLAAIWVGVVALENTGWRDTDGWVDCNDYCNGWHRTGAVLFWTPLLAGVLLVLVLVGGLLARVARRNR